MIDPLFALISPMCVVVVIAHSTIDFSDRCNDLAAAASKGDTIEVQALLANGADPNCTLTRKVEPWTGDGPRHYDTTALVEAVKAHKITSVQVLLNAGADPSKAVHDGRRPPLYFAIRPQWGYDPPIAIALLEAGADPLQDVDADHPVIYDTAYHGLFPVLRSAVTCLIRDERSQELIAEMPALRKLVDYPSAVYRSRYLEEIARLLLNLSDESKLSAADRASHAILEQDYVELENHAATLGLNDKHRLIEWSLLHGDGRASALLLESINSHEYLAKQEDATILNCAVQGGNVDNVRLVLEGNARLLNETDTYGISPLNIALQERYRDVASLLLARGADLDVGHLRGRTPRQYIEQHGGLEQVLTPDQPP